jgi:hypothetical protein
MKAWIPSPVQVMVTSTGTTVVVLMILGFAHAIIVIAATDAPTTMAFPSMSDSVEGIPTVGALGSWRKIVWPGKGPRQITGRFEGYRMRLPVVSE